MDDLPGPEELECGLNELGRSSGVDEVDETASLPPAAPFSDNTSTYVWCGNIYRRTNWILVSMLLTVYYLILHHVFLSRPLGW